MLRQIQPSNDLAIGIDLGGTQVRAGLIDRNGVVLKRIALPTAAGAGPATVIDQLGQAADAVAAAVPAGRIGGVGLCSPGPLDTERGLAISIPTLAGFVDLPLAGMLERRIGLPVLLENDGIAAVVAEWRYGAGQGYSNVVYVTVSTGIGGGIVSEGRPLRGRMGMAGHIGHMTIVRDGERCSCGNSGCWEAYASGTAFARRALLRAQQLPTSLLGADGEPVEGRTVFAAAARGDRLAVELVAEEADMLGVGIANLLHLYSPDVVIIGGGMASGFEALLPGIRARLATAAMPPFRDIPVVAAGLAGNSGVIGAATLIFDAAETERRPGA